MRISAAHLSGLALACFLALASTAQADPTLSLVGLNSSYQVGETIEFDVLLNDATNLSLFQISLLMETTAAATAPGDFAFTGAIPTTQFVFPDPTMSFIPPTISVSTSPNPEGSLIALSGFTLGEVSTGPTNSVIARVSAVWTKALDPNSFVDVTFSVLQTFNGSNALELLDSRGGSIPGYSNVVSNLTPVSTRILGSQAAVVPEPSTALSGLLALAVLAGFRKRIRSAIKK